MFNLKHFEIYFEIFCCYKHYIYAITRVDYFAADVISACAEQMFFQEKVKPVFYAFLSMFVNILKVMLYENNN